MNALKMSLFNEGNVSTFGNASETSTNLSWGRQAGERTWFKAIDDMKPYLRNYMWFVCGFGLPGNMLIIALILRMRSRGMASCMLVYLAVFDSLALLAKLVQRNVFYSDIRIGTFGCKVVSIPEMSFASIANWTLVLISAERFVTICYPLQRQRLLTNFRIKIILIALPVILIGYAVALNVTFLDENKHKCGPKYIRFYVYLLIAPITNIITPFVFLLIFTICVVTSIRTLSKKRSQRLKSVTSLKNDRKSSQSASQEMENTLSNLMLAAAILFFAVNALYCVYTLIMFPVYVKNLTTSVTFTRFAALMISDWNHALNFYVYILFCKSFRANLWRMCKSWSGSLQTAFSCSWWGSMPVSGGPTQDSTELPSSSSLV